MQSLVILQTTRLWSLWSLWTSKKYNMKMNVKKTKVMLMPWRKVRKLRIVANGKEVESVKQFCCLGSMVTKNCKSKCEVRCRTALAKEAFNKKKDLKCGSRSL